MREKPPLPLGAAAKAVGKCVLASAVLLARGRVRFPRRHVGERVHFADGTSARVYRETLIDRAARSQAALLVVEFRLRWVRGQAHALFRWESWLNTPLFVGFPGFVSKLWVAHYESGAYRGLYEWDGADLAEDYARALWRVLALVSVTGSIHYQVLPGQHRDTIMADPVLGARAELQPWACPVALTLVRSPSDTRLAGLSR